VAKYNLPSPVGTPVTSAHHFWLIADPVKSSCVVTSMRWRWCLHRYDSWGTLPARRAVVARGYGVVFESDYLELAIGVAAIFFLLSMVVSGINEGLQWMTRVRAKFLWAYLYDLADPSRTKALPPQRVGVLGLWGKQRDRRPRPRALLGAEQEPATASTERSKPLRSLWKTVVAVGRSVWTFVRGVVGFVSTLVRRVKRALWGSPSPPLPAADTGEAVGFDAETVVWHLSRSFDPIAPGEQVGIGGESKKRTTIKNVPPPSLAQAFLEVFAEVGKTNLADSVAAMVIALASTDDDKVIDRITDGLGGSDQLAATTLATSLREFRHAVAGAESGDIAVAAGNTLGSQIQALSTETAANELPAAGESLARAAFELKQAAGTDRHPSAEQACREQARSFAAVLVNAFPDRFPRLRIETAIAGLGNSPLGPTARRLWEAAGGQIDKFRTGLEGWFDSEMSRLSGYYRRSLRTVVMILAILVTLVLNVDAIALTRDLWRNPGGRAALMAQADALTEQAPAASTSVEGPPEPADTPTLPLIKEQCEAATARDGEVIDSVDKATAAYGRVRTCIADALNELRSLDVIDRGLLIGPSAWADDMFPWYESSGETADEWWLHLAGLVLTVIALVVGAPYWFDIVKRLTGARRGLVGHT
jgi:hypothetical protein